MLLILRIIAIAMALFNQISVADKDPKIYDTRFVAQCARSNSLGPSNGRKK